MCESRIGAHTIHPFAMKLPQDVVNMPAVVLEIKKFKNCTSLSTRCCPFPTGACTVCPIAIKLAQVILNRIEVVLDIKKI